MDVIEEKCKEQYTEEEYIFNCMDTSEFEEYLKSDIQKLIYTNIQKLHTMLYFNDVTLWHHFFYVKLTN